MQIAKLTKRETELLLTLSTLIKEYGFKEVLSLLEQVASNHADISPKHWECIRRNLEDSILEIEEFNISSDLN